MGIKELASSERPRERLLAKGATALSDTELIALLLGSGTKGLSVLEVARGALERYGGLSSMARADPGELRALRGLGPARAATLAAALELGRRAQAPREERLCVRGSVEVFAYYAPRLSHLTHEVFHVMCLDAKHRLLQDARVSSGGLASCTVSPREAYAPALRAAAASVIFVHNHPSGDPEPSRDDLALTARLKQAGKIMGISPLDHLIIGEGRYVSLVDDGRFEVL